MPNNADLLKSFLSETNASQGSSIERKAFAWARVSTDMQEKMGLSIPEQLRQISEFAEREGYEIVAEYQETGSAFREGATRMEGFPFSVTS